MDGDFPWVLFGIFLLWVFRMLGGRGRAKVQGPQPTRRPRLPEAPPPYSSSDSTQTEGAQLEELLRALERRLDPDAETLRPRPVPTPSGPLGRPSTVRLPESEDLEERESLETEPVVETLEREVRRTERVALDRRAQAEAKERARLAAVEARDREPHKARHAAFDQRIRAEQPAPPVARRLTNAEIRQAFIWGEILGRPKAG